MSDEKVTTPKNEIQNWIDTVKNTNTYDGYDYGPDVPEIEAVKTRTIKVLKSIVWGSTMSAVSNSLADYDGKDLKKIIETINENVKNKIEDITNADNFKKLSPIKEEREKKKEEDFLELLTHHYDKVDLEKDIITVGTPLYAYQYFYKEKAEDIHSPISVIEYEPKYELESMKPLGKFLEYVDELEIRVNLEDGSQKEIKIKKNDVDTRGTTRPRKIKIYKKKTDEGEKPDQQGGRRRSKKSRNRKSKKKFKKKGRKTKRRS